MTPVLSSQVSEDRPASRSLTREPVAFPDFTVNLSIHIATTGSARLGQVGISRKAKACADGLSLDADWPGLKHTWISYFPRISFASLACPSVPRGPVHSETAGSFLFQRAGAEADDAFRARVTADAVVISGTPSETSVRVILLG